MKQWNLSLLTACLAMTVGLSAPALAADKTEADIAYHKGQEAYNQGRLDEALVFFNQATSLNPNYADAYFNQGAIYYNRQNYSKALTSFTKLLQLDPNDQAARYELARVYEKLGRKDEAIAAFEMISPTSSRYKKAQENIARLNRPAPQQQAENPYSDPASEPEKNSKTGVAVSKEFITGFFGPTGVAVDEDGTVYVANFSKNNIYKVMPNGDKKILASGEGINGPVGLVLDQKTGDLYIANHLDNTIARINRAGKVSVVATDLKKPYNLFLDQSRRTLYVSEQETNSVSRIKLN